MNWATARFAWWTFRVLTLCSQMYLLSREASLIINIVDATNLERNLFLTSQLADMKIPMVIAVNMMDIAENRGIQLDLDELSDFYGVPCIPLSAVSEKSVTNFISQMGHVLASPMPLPKQMVYGDKVEEAVKVLEPKVAPVAKLLDADSRWVSLMYLGNEKSYADKFAEAGVKLDKAEVVKILGEEPEFAMAENRYSISHEVAGKAIVSARAKKTFSDKLDAVLLNRWAALPIFLVIMYLVFWIAVTIGSAFMWMASATCWAMYSAAPPLSRQFSPTVSVPVSRRFRPSSRSSSSCSCAFRSSKTRVTWPARLSLQTVS